MSVEQARSADLKNLASILNDPAYDAKSRDEAAKRLVSRQSADSRKILLDVLVNAGNPKGQQSVARALADGGATDSAYVDPLFALFGSDKALSEAAADALATYKSSGTVLNRLIELAQSPRDTRESARAAAVRAIGSFADKRAAAVLIELVQSRTEPAAVRNAACDGLSDMTGLTENGRAASLWIRWWAPQSGKSDAAFHDDLLMQRSAQVDHLRARESQVAAELESLIKEQYQAAPDTAKDALLLKWLRSGEPRVRLVAAGLVVDDFNSNRPFGAPVKEQLRTMVADSSPDVRLQVAKTVRQINDTLAFDALLLQLNQEPIAGNRAALALALSQSRDLRAVPELVKLLNDSEPLIVAEAGASALANLGPLLIEKDPGTAKGVAARLRTVFRTRTENPGAERLREVVIEAIVPLRDTAMLTTFTRLLNLKESERVRRASLRGIAELHELTAVDVVVDWLKREPDPSVKREAIVTIGVLGGTDQFQILYEYMLPATPGTDAAVNEQAWQVFQSLLPQATTEQINRWPSRFQIDPEKRVIVLKALADKLLKDKNLGELAKTRQNIGQSLMASTPPQPTEAATYFKLSLEYFQQNNVPQMVIETNIQQLLSAQLASKQYNEAAQFAASLIKDNQGNQQTIGPLFKQEADRLRNANDLQNALKLITETKQMQPELEGRYKDMLLDIEKEVQQRMTTQNQRNKSTGPLPNAGMRVS